MARPSIAGREQVHQSVRPSTQPDREIELELLAQAIAAFDDDQPRHVLADFWLQRNDPRGELMALAVQVPWGILPDLGAWLEVFSKLGAQQLYLLIPGLQLENIRWSHGRYSFRVRAAGHIHQNVEQAFAGLFPEEVERLEIIVVHGVSQPPVLSHLRQRYAQAVARAAEAGSGSL